MGNSSLVPQNIKHKVTIWSNNFISMYIPKRSGNVCPCKHLHMNIYSTIIHDSLRPKQHNYSSTDEQIHKIECVDTLEYYLAPKRDKVVIHAITRMNLENITLSERSQTQKTRYCLIPLTWNVQNRQISRHKDWWSAGSGEWGMLRTEWWLTTNESRVSSGGDKDVLK